MARWDRSSGQFEGTLDQFSGDGIMVFFNHAVPCPDPAERAVKMAMAMRKEAGKLVSQPLSSNAPIFGYFGLSVLANCVDLFAQVDRHRRGPPAGEVFIPRPRRSAASSPGR